MWRWVSTYVSKLTFSDVGSVASLLSLAITIYLFHAVRRIKSFYVFKARVPELTEQLRTHASRLATLHRDFDGSRDEVLLELGKAEVTLKSLKKKIGRPTKKSVGKAIKLIDNYPYNKTKNNLWQVYVDLQKVVQEVIEVQSDRSWE